MPLKAITLPVSSAENPHKMPRRDLLRHGLTAFAVVMAKPWLAGCSSADNGVSRGIDGMAGSGTDHVDNGVGGAGGADVAAGGSQAGGDRPLISRIGELGDLESPDELGLRLPKGFTGRIVARSGEPAVAGAKYRWHSNPDGGATYATPDGGWIYVSNSETGSNAGGVGALLFDANGTLVDSYGILSNTNRNCAGGKTPWQTWLSCEETGSGLVYESDPFGVQASQVWPALGAFKHEAVAVDPETMALYLTEDEGDGRFYRFVPAEVVDGRPTLDQGELQVVEMAADGSVQWHRVPDPSGSTKPTRRQVASSTSFNGGEGIWYHAGMVYFATKGDNRIWAYDLNAMKMSVLYDKSSHGMPILSGVDNVTVSCCGDVLVAEDGGDMEIVALLPDGRAKPLLQIVGQGGSEVTGPAFDPSGTRLYFSSQRGDAGAGITYEVTGPFHATQ